MNSIGIFIEASYYIFFFYLAIVGMFAFLEILFWLGASDDTDMSMVIYRTKVSLYLYVTLFITSCLLTAAVVIGWLTFFF